MCANSVYMVVAVRGAMGTTIGSFLEMSGALIAEVERKTFTHIKTRYHSHLGQMRVVVLWPNQ